VARVVVQGTSWSDGASVLARATERVRTGLLNAAAVTDEYALVDPDRNDVGRRGRRRSDRHQRRVVKALSRFELRRRGRFLRQTADPGDPAEDDGYVALRRRHRYERRSGRIHRDVGPALVRDRVLRCRVELSLLDRGQGGRIGDAL